MKSRKISKGGHRHRIVFCPSPEEKARFRSLLPALAELERKQARHFGVATIAHGFVESRNQVTCALRHVGFDATYCFDLKGWFDSITEEQLICSGISEQIAREITINGKLRQGLPTSPTAANIAAVRFDRAVYSGLSRYTDRYGKFSYTRYADDIAISWSADENARYVAAVTVERAAGMFNWTVAASKTRFYLAKSGFRIICGIAVGEHGIQATRETRRKLRAATRNTKWMSTKTDSVRRRKALEEWAKCPLPRSARGTRRLAGVSVVADSRKQIETPKIAPIPISGSTRRLFLGEQQ